MHTNTHSDIASLFSKLPYAIHNYQEIANIRRLERASSSWALLREIQFSVKDDGSENLIYPESNLPK
jgi:hypothetical protein